MKHLSLLTLALCALVSTSFAQYTLTVEEITTIDYMGMSVVDGSDSTITVETGDLGTVYRFYINVEDSTDQVSAVYGNNQATLSVSAPDGIYNSPFNSLWNASGLNSAFFGQFPELIFDSYATIGLEGPASTSGIANAADPGLVEDPLQPITPFFQTPGATSLEVSSQIGSSWFVTNGTGNASPQGGSLRVLVMQVTSTGPVSGQINYQVFPMGDGSAFQKYVTPFDGPGTFEGDLFIEVEGCMDSTACNYDQEANLQPIGSCNFPDQCGNCDGEETGPGIPDGACDCDGNFLDDCGVCGGDNSSCEGCALSQACNYDPEVPFEANNPDLCVIPNADCGCATDMDGNNTGELEGDADGDGVCDTIDECVDVSACNYDANPSEPCAIEDECGVCGGDGIADGACDCDGNVEDAIGFCGGDCTADEDMDGICDDQDVCTDTTACNYDFNPTEICLYLDALDSCGGNCFAADSTGCIELIMYGCTDSLACNYDAMANTSDDSCLGEDDACDDGDDSTINDTYDADCGCVGEAVVDGCTDPLACNYDEDANMDDGSCLGSGDACDDMDENTINDMYNDTCACVGDLIVLGCTDSLACNYNVDANVDDGTCAEFDALDVCGGDCFEADSLGNCLETIMEGCTDEMACNYDEMANTDDGSCLVIGESCDDMNDMTFNDIVNDSCECVGTLTVLGCLDSLACNYDMDANMDSEMCEFPGDDCDDLDVNTINDSLGVDCICVGVDTTSGDTTFVFEFERLEFGMFPNPTTGEVTLRVDGFHAGVTMQVMDGAGRVVWSEQNLALQGNTVFDLSRLSAGTYNVMLSDERGISVKRLAIQK